MSDNIHTKAPLYRPRSSPPILSSASSMTTEFPRITWEVSVHIVRKRGYKAAGTYHHAQTNLLATLLLFHRLVEDNVQEDLLEAQYQ